MNITGISRQIFRFKADSIAKLIYRKQSGFHMPLKNESGVRSHFVSSINVWTDTNKCMSVVVIHSTKERLRAAHEQAARRTNVMISCVCALFDKPIRLRAFLHAVRKTNQNSCLCLPVVPFVHRFYFKSKRRPLYQCHCKGIFNIIAATERAFACDFPALSVL